MLCWLKKKLFCRGSSAPASESLTSDSSPTGTTQEGEAPKDRRSTTPIAPPSDHSTIPEVLRYQVPSSLGKSMNCPVYHKTSPSKEDCAICMLPLSSNVARLKVCGHVFHVECLEAALRIRPSCPLCRKLVQEPQGHSPPGTMHIRYTPDTLQGYEQYGQCIWIEYSLPGGTQKSYHENPGQKFPSTTRYAYLPNNQDGRRLLKRLKYAWMHGLTFTVGTSITTGRHNRITWSSIHHKTSLTGGTYGFPDPNYFMNCNEELDNLGVPSWESCP